MFYVIRNNDILVGVRKTYDEAIELRNDDADDYKLRQLFNNKFLKKFLKKLATLDHPRYVITCPIESEVTNSEVFQ